jgi:uncharacterized heparinase superfamily protein
MARAVGFSDYASASWLAVRREASSTINALGLPRLLPAAGLSGDGLDQLPEDFYSADSERGDAMCDGRFALAGDQLSAQAGSDIWAMLAPSRTFATRLHGFGWLRHVIAAEQHDGAAEARRLVDAWTAQFGSWNSFAWSHGVLSSRVLNWLRCGEALFGDTGEPDKVRRARLRALHRQVRYLKRAISLANDGPVRLRCAVALSLSGLCLPRQSGLYKTGLIALAREVERQILPDGGHVTRSPRATMEALIDLVTLRDAAEYAQLPVPVSLQKAIDRLRPMTRFFVMADGGDLRGEDALYRPVEDGPPEDVDRRLRFAIRFHLHPDVRASLSRDNMSALLVQPNGDGWRFRTDGGPLTLERSVYLAAGAPPQRSQQIVIFGEAESYGAGDKPPNRVRWAFQRLGRVGGAGGEAE